MYQRYQELLDKKGLKSIDVSKATGISSATLSDWKRGVSTPKSDKLEKIAQYLGVSIDYLRTGKDSTMENIGLGGSLYELIIDPELSKAMVKLSKLNSLDRKLVMNLIDSLYDKTN